MTLIKWTSVLLAYVVPLVLYLNTVYASGSEYRDERMYELAEMQQDIVEARAAKKSEEAIIAEIEKLEEQHGKLDHILPRDLSPESEITLFERVAAGEGVWVDVEAEEPIRAEKHRVLPLSLSFTGTWEGVGDLLDRLREPSPEEGGDDSEIGTSRRIFHWTELSLVELDPGAYGGVLDLHVYFSGRDPRDVGDAPAPSRPEATLAALRSPPGLQHQVEGGGRGRSQTSASSPNAGSS